MPKLNQVKERFIYLSPTVQAGWEDESNIHDFEGQKVLGKGAFGKVLRVLHKKSKLIYAVKEISKRNLKQQGMVEQVTNEVKIMYSMNHPYILKQYNHFEDDCNIYLVLEYAAGGQLYAAMWKQPSKCFEEKIVAKYTFQLAKALEQVHAKGVIHRDIKPENILLDKDGNIKLADFGWSNFKLKESDVRTTFCGTLDYLAPEMLEESHAHDFGVDIWSVGVLCYELLTGASPFAPKSNQQNSEYVDKWTRKNIQDLKFTYPEGFPPMAKDLINKILILKSKDRLPLKDIAAHPWINLQNENIPLFETIEVTKEIKKTQLVDEAGQEAKTVFTKDEIYKYSRPDSIINKDFDEKVAQKQVPLSNFGSIKLNNQNTSMLLTGGDINKQMIEQQKIKKMQADIQELELYKQKKEKECESLKQQLYLAQKPGGSSSGNPFSDPRVLDKLKEKDEILKEAKKEYDYLKQRFTEQDALIVSLKKSVANQQPSTHVSDSVEVDRLKDENIFLKAQLEQLKAADHKTASTNNSFETMTARINEYRERCERLKEELAKSQQELGKAQSNKSCVVSNNTDSSTNSTSQSGGLDLESYLDELKQRQLKQLHEAPKKMFNPF